MYLDYYPYTWMNASRQTGSISLCFVCSNILFGQRCVKSFRFTVTVACAESIPPLFSTDLSIAAAKFRASMLLRKVAKQKQCGGKDRKHILSRSRYRQKHANSFPGMPSPSLFAANHS